MSDPMPTESAQQGPSSPGWHPNADGEKRWWTGEEWWTLERVAEILLPRSSPAPQGAAPGWYRRQNGEIQWWNGLKWLGDYEVGAILLEGTTGRREPAAAPMQAPGPDYEQSPEPREKKGMGCFGWTVTIILVIVGIVFFSSVARSSSSGTADSSSSSGSAAASSQGSAAQQYDEQMKAQGWEAAVSGDTYYRFPTEEEKAEASCGYYGCIYVVVVSIAGCGSGFYVKADILSSGTPVGWTNEISAGGGPREPVVVRLEDHQDVGDAFRISEVYCMG